MFQPQFETIKTDAKTRLNNVNTALSVKLNSKDEIDKVLCVNINAEIVSYECMQEEAMIMGKCNYRLLVLNTSKDVVGMTYTADFSERVQGEINPDSKLFFDVTVMDSDYKVNTNSVELDTLLDIAATCHNSNEINVVVGSEDAMVRTQPVSVGFMRKCQRLTTTIENEMKVKHNISRILLAESFVSIKDYFATDGVLNVNGRATVAVTYITSEGELVSSMLPFDFNQEVMAEGIDANDSLIVRAKAQQTKVHFNIVEDMENDTFTVEIVVRLDVCCYTTEQKEIAVDAYSTSNEMNLTLGQIKSSITVGNYNYEVETKNSIDMEGSISRLATISNMQARVTKVAPYIGQTTVEGYVSGDLIYENEETMESKQIELPFTYDIIDDWIGDGMNFEVTPTILDFDYRLDKQEVDVAAKIQLSISASKDITVNGVTEMSLGEEIQKDNAIEVVMARKGDSLWDIAKWLNMKEEEILAVNPDIVTPLNEDAKIVVYHKI